MIKSKKRVIPSKILILEILEEHGRIYEEKLKGRLQDAYDEFSQTLLYDNLMSLEAEGFIIVRESGSRKGKIIEIAKEHQYIQIGEE